MIFEQIYKRNISFLFYLSQMKKASIVGLSADNKLVVFFFDNQNFFETRFQGFDIAVNHIKLRPLFDQLLGKDIECSLNKNDKLIRYQNQSLFIDLLQKGAVRVNSKELEESKIYSPEQKLKFTQISKTQPSQQSSNPKILLNDNENSSLIQTIIKNKNVFNAKIQYLAQKILLRFVYQGQTVFLQSKILNCKHYFQLFSQTTFWKANFLPKDISVQIVCQKHNLLQKSNDVYVKLQDEIVEKLLSYGWLALDQKTYYKNSKDLFLKLREAQKDASKNAKGIYSTKSQILSFIYAKNNYVGVVTNIFEGFIYQIESLKTQQTHRIQLPMVICPLGIDAGSFQCRQFARRQLIGKEVNVYLNKQEGLNTTGNIIRTQDWKDIETILLQNGYAVVRDEFRASILGQKLVIIENKAKQKNKGIHRKDLGIKRFQDLTSAPISKSHIQIFLNKRFEVLNKIGQKEEVVIQEIINSVTYKIRVISMNVLLNIRLESVIEPFLNPNLKEAQQIKSKAEKFLKRHIHQRTTIASISDYDNQTNNFIGTLMLEKQKTDIQELLINQCLVYTDKYCSVKKYHDIQIQAKKTQKLLWQPQLVCFEPGYDIQKEKYLFEGKFSWIHNGKIAYIHPKDNFERLQKLQINLRKIKMNRLPQEKQRNGAWCAAPYDGEIYRAVIKQKKNNIATVQFFDWGNQQNINVAQLKDLPQEFLYLQSQCIKVSLNLVSQTKDKESLEKIRQMLIDGSVYVFKKVYGDSINFYADKESPLNQQLIFKGLLKADKQEIKRYQNSELIHSVQEELRKQKIGIWEESQSSDDEKEDY